MTDPVLRCPLCWGIGRIRKPIAGGRATWAQCPACPPSESVNEAMDRAAADRTTPKGEREP